MFHNQLFAQKKIFQSHFIISYILMAFTLTTSTLIFAQKTPVMPAPVKACDLLTAPEAQTIIGGAVNEPQSMQKQNENDNSWMTMCNYFSPEKNVSLGVMIRPHDVNISAAEAYTSLIKETREQMGKEFVLEPVDGLGDKSGWEKSTKQLYIFKGPYIIIMTVMNPALDAPSSMELGKKAANKILSKL